MRAAVWTEGGRPMEVEELSLADLGPLDVRVRVTLASVCVTDAIASTGEMPWRTPHVFGHAAVGIVEAVGSDVRRVAIGDRVVASATGQCMTCRWCLEGRADQCNAAPVQGSAKLRRPDGTPVVANSGVGAYAEEMIVGEAQLVPVRSELPDEQLASLGCTVSTGLGAALLTVPVWPGATVAVVGCGPVGLSYIQGARLAGAEQIIAIEPIAARRELARRFGATELVDPESDEQVDYDRAVDAFLIPSPHYAVAKVRSLTGGLGTDIVFEAAADTAAMTMALSIARRAGHVILSSVPWDAMQNRLSFIPIEAAIHGRTIHSCQLGSVHLVRDIPRFAGLLESQAVDAKLFAEHRFGLLETDAALQAVGGHEAVGAVVDPTVDRVAREAQMG